MRYIHILFLCFCLLFQQNKAQSQPRARNEYALFEEIPEVIVASKKFQSADLSPANVYVITGAEMRARGYTNVHDALKDLPGITWNPTIGNVSNGSPVIRGLSQKKRLKVMLNGMVLDEKAGSGFAWDQNMPVEGIDRIEFILGPYSALYGRNTFSGVINIVTKKGSDLDGGIVTGLYGEWNRVQSSVILGKKTGNWDVYFSLFKNYSRTGQDLTEEYPELYSRTAREASLNPTNGAPVKFAPGVSDDYSLFWDFTDSYLSVRHDNGFGLDISVTQNIWPMAGTYTTPLFYAQPREAEMTRELFNSKISYEHIFEKITSNTALHFQNWQGRGILSYLDGNYRVYRTETDALEISQNFIASLTDRNSLLIGLSYETVSALPSLGSDRTTTIQDPDTSGHFMDMDFTNITAQDEIRLTDALTVVAGIMYEHSNTYDDVVLPRASLVWSISSQTTAKLLYATGYITPELSYLNNQILPNNRSIKGASNFKPEHLTAYEVNIIHHFNDHNNISLSAYLNQVEDVIYLVNNTGSDANTFPFVYRNAGEQETRGAEATINLGITDKIKIFTTCGYVEGHYLEAAEDGTTEKKKILPLTAQYHIKSGIHFLLYEDRMNLYIHNLYTGPIDSWSKTKEYGNYNILDVNLLTTPVMHEQWSVSIGVNNLLDKKALDCPSESFLLSAPPTIKRRNWTVSVSYKW